MRLVRTKLDSTRHKDLVSCLEWSAQNEVITCSDDHSILSWNISGEPLQEISKMDDIIFTDIHRAPLRKKKTDHYAIACTNGSFRLLSRGRQTSQEAHQGAVLCIRWSRDGTQLATSGEDGLVKVWSRSGDSSRIVQSEFPVFCLSWGPTDDQIVYTSGPNLAIRPLHVSNKQTVWQAHEGVVLQCDWSPASNLIVSCGEDCTYRVWTTEGRQVFCSRPLTHIVTSVAWAPSGELFVVGSFNTLRLCDKAGWTHYDLQVEAASLFQTKWNSDGTVLAAAGGNGAVVFAQIVDRRLHWRNITAVMSEPTHITVHDIVSETMEQLDFRDRLQRVELSCDHLVAVTQTQCFLYDVHNWNTPQILEFKGTVALLVLSYQHFLLATPSSGLTISGYDGRTISTPRVAAPTLASATQHTVALNSRYLAMVERDAQALRIFDVRTGNPMGDPIMSQIGIVEIALSQHSDESLLAMIDKNRGLQILNVRSGETVKIASVVSSIMWHDSADMLAALSDGQIHVWVYPHGPFIEQGCADRTCIRKPASEFGEGAQVIGFHSNHITVRRADGVTLHATIPPYPLKLCDLAKQRDWDRSIRLCRFVRDPVLWSCLSVMALSAQEIHAAEVATAALEQTDKLQYLIHIRKLEHFPVHCKAELLVFQRRPDEAEQVLLESRLVYRAIKLNMRLFRWERALKIAEVYPDYREMIMAYRQRYLKMGKREETEPSFLRMQEQFPPESLDWERIKQFIAQAKESEKEMIPKQQPRRPAARRPSAGTSRTSPVPGQEPGPQGSQASPPLTHTPPMAPTDTHAPGDAIDGALYAADEGDVSINGDDLEL